MMALAGAMFSVLAIIAALHAYWAFGGLWPAKSERGLIETVVGAQNAEKMPTRWITLLVSGCILSSGILPVLAIGGQELGVPDWIIAFGLLVCAAVFVLRGAVTYVWPTSFSNSTEPFRTLNRRYYSPLCLGIGVGFLWIWFA